MQQIGGKILLASGSITYVVDKLEQKGMLEELPVQMIEGSPMHKLQRMEKIYSRYFSGTCKANR